VAARESHAQATAAESRTAIIAPRREVEGMRMGRIAGWGRHPVVEGVEVLSEDLEAATRDVRLSRGLGRSYGDSSLPPRPGDRVANTRLADRILSFDAESGILRAEAGLCLATLHQLFLPRGFASPVAPGTELVTLGGMVAADVHGKNHHRAGTFGEWVRALRMRVADGRVLEVTEESEPELFRATLGGLGLTGHILEVEFQMQRIPSPWVWQEIEQVANLDELIRKLEDAGRDWPHTLCWVDCVSRGRRLGRGVLFKGRWAEPDEAPARPPAHGWTPPRLPVDLPGFAVSRPIVRVLNELYFQLQGRPRRGIAHPRAFFHPLDHMLPREWNRAYGRRGLTQHQPVLPRDPTGESYRRFFDVLTESGEASGLCVLKDFGREGRGLLSFPMPGITVNVDLPVRGERTQRVVDRMNEIVLEAGGRVYLAKDALTRGEHFRAMEGARLEAFLEVRRKWDPEGRIASAQWARLMGERA
jgi:FAD/FMN-containing dehydrogenase